MTISNASRMQLNVAVDEQYFDRVKKGTAVEVVVPTHGLRPIPARITSVDFVFEPRRLSNAAPGLYDIHEPPGPHQMHLQVEVHDPNANAKPLQPGSIGYVIFPFEP